MARRVEEIKILEEEIRRLEKVKENKAVFGDTEEVKPAIRKIDMDD